MKSLLLLSLTLVLVLPLQAQVWFASNATVRAVNVVGVDAPSKALELTNYTSTTTVCAGGAERWVGGIFNLATGGQITKATFMLSKSVGSVVGKTYTCYVYSLTGNNLNAVLGTSIGVLGSDAWSNTPVEFTFPLPVAFSAGTAYAIVISTGSDDGSNYAVMHAGADSALIDLAKWNSSSLNTDLYSTAAPYIVLWKQ